jgi:hypothetical protein
MPVTNASAFREGLRARQWQYVDARVDATRLDPAYRGPKAPPVFAVDAAVDNVLFADDDSSEVKEAVLRLVPTRHRWFRSASSSQALALSVFGNLLVRDKLDRLSGLTADDGRPLFGDLYDPQAHVQLEHDVGRRLGERRATSIDFWIAGARSVAVECKLTEVEVGACSRPHLGRAAAKYCDGSLRRRAGWRHACSLAEHGDADYWRWLPELCGWDEDEEREVCPLRGTYQLVRNLLAVCARSDGRIDDAAGHVVLLTHGDNPAFLGDVDGGGGRGARTFHRLRAALGPRRHLIQLCTWQRIAAALAEDAELAWLVDGMRDKYGIEADFSRIA